MKNPSLPLYCVFNLLNNQVGDHQDYSRYVMHPEYGLFAVAPGVSPVDIESWINKLPNIPTDNIIPAVFNHEPLLDGVPRIDARWLCDPIDAVRLIESGATTIITGESTVVVPEVLIRPVATGDDIDLLQLFSFVARDLAEQGFHTCVDPAGLIKLRRYLLLNRNYDGVIL